MTETAVWDSPDATTTPFPQGLHSETLLMMDFHFSESTGVSNSLATVKKSPQYGMVFYEHDPTFQIFQLMYSNILTIYRSLISDLSKQRTRSFIFSKQ